MTINSTAMILLALYVAVARKQDVPLSELSGTVQNDILKEYLARGTYIYPPEASMRIVTDLFAWAGRELPKWNVISISGYHVREAGATATQEVAFTLANAIAYIQAALDAGLKLDDFAPRLSFFFSSDRNFLEEIAKFRAARRLYAGLLKERFGAENPRSCTLRFHAQTGGSTLTAQQPYVNVVRTAFEALAAVLGGAQSLHTNGFDEALALPSEDAARLALRTQQVLAYESGVTNTADPVGGSYCIESLTDEIEAGARAYIERIDAMGGMIRAIRQGYVQREIQNAAYAFQQKVEKGEQILVGVNAFRLEKEEPVPILRIDPALEKRQLEQLQQLKQTRDNTKMRHSLGRVAEAASSTDNLMPAILEAVESYATLGEISDTLRQAFGVHEDRTVF
jgi:methylmalonyl-CoA mutase N-terminal domain/subunit